MARSLRLNLWLAVSLLLSLCLTDIRPGRFMLEQICGKCRACSEVRGSTQTDTSGQGWLSCISAALRCHVLNLCSAAVSGECVGGLQGGSEM